MHTDQIQAHLKTLNASAAKPKAKAKPQAAPAVKTNGVTHYSDEETLLSVAERIVAALDLASKGVTAESLVTSVHAFEKPYEGVVQ